MKNISTKTRVKKCHQMMKKMLNIMNDSKMILDQISSSHQNYSRLNGILSEESLSYLEILKSIATKKCLLPREQDSASRFVDNLLKLFFESLNSQPIPDGNEFPQAIKLAINGLCRKDEETNEYQRTLVEPETDGEYVDSENDESESDDNDSEQGVSEVANIDQPEIVESRISERRSSQSFPEDLNHKSNKSNSRKSEPLTLLDNSMNIPDLSVRNKSATEQICSTRIHSSLEDTCDTSFSIPSIYMADNENDWRKQRRRSIMPFSKRFSSCSMEKTVVEQTLVPEPQQKTSVSEEKRSSTTIVDDDDTIKDYTVVMAKPPKRRSAVKEDTSIKIKNFNNKKTTKTKMDNTTEIVESETSFSAGRYLLRNTINRSSRNETSIVGINNNTTINTPKRSRKTKKKK